MGGNLDRMEPKHHMLLIYFDFLFFFLQKESSAKLKLENAIQKPSSKVDGRSTIPKPKTVSEASLIGSSSIPKSESDNKLLSLKGKTTDTSLTTKGRTQTELGNDTVKPLEPDNPIKQSKISSLAPKIKPPSSPSSVKSSTSRDNLTSGGGINAPVSVMQSSQGSQILGNSAGCTIPKPTAAVKGTTKVQKDDDPKSQSIVRSVQPQVVEVNNQSPSTADIIPNRDIDAMKNRSPASGGGSNRSGPLPKAMVSPMMSTKVSRNETTANNEDAFVRNKIETAFDKSSNVITQDICLRKNVKEGDEDDVSVNIKPMNPLSRASHYGYISSLSSSRNLAPSIHVPTYRMQQQGDANYGMGFKLQAMARKGLVANNNSLDDVCRPRSIQFSLDLRIIDGNLIVTPFLPTVFRRGFGGPFNGLHVGWRHVESKQPVRDGYGHHQRIHERGRCIAVCPHQSLQRRLEAPGVCQRLLRRTKHR